MRESGLSNREIAERLEVGYATICRYLGRNPNKSAKGEAVHVTHTEKPSALKLLDKCTKLRGSDVVYIVNEVEKRISFTACFQNMNKEKLDTLISELTELRNMLEG